MRPIPLLAASLLLLPWPLAAQAPGPRFIASLSGGSATLVGHFSVDEAASDVDLKRDLGNDGSGSLGAFSFEYQASRFRVRGAMDEMTPRSSQADTRELTFRDYRYPAGTRVATTVHSSALDVVGTYLLVSRPGFWLGVDAGVLSWEQLIETSGVGYERWDSTHVDLAQRDTGQLMMHSTECLGLSGALRLLDDRLQLQASLEAGSLDGRSTALATAHAQYFVLPHVGLRAFLERRTISGMPNSRLTETERYHFAREILGLGVVARW